MAIAPRAKRRAEEYIEEVKELIRARFPGAEFSVVRRDPKEYWLEVLADFDDMFDVLDVTSERTTDILVETGILIAVLPLGRVSSTSG